MARWRDTTCTYTPVSIVLVFATASSWEHHRLYYKSLVDITIPYGLCTGPSSLWFQHLLFTLAYNWLPYESYFSLLKSQSSPTDSEFCCSCWTRKSSRITDLQYSCSHIAKIIERIEYKILVSFTLQSSHNNPAYWSLGCILFCCEQSTKPACMLLSHWAAYVVCALSYHVDITSLLQSADGWTV